jgi:hypothetical protein
LAVFCRASRTQKYTAADAVHRHRDRQRGPPRLGFKRRGQPLVGQQRRVDAASQRPQVLQRRGQPVAQLPGRCSYLGRVVGDRVKQAELDPQRHKLLLGAVMQVPLDPLPLGVLGLH